LYCAPLANVSEATAISIAIAIAFITAAITTITITIISRTLVRSVPVQDINRVLMHHKPSALEIALSLHDDLFLVEPAVKSYISELWLGSFNATDEDSVIMHWKVMYFT
jgi:hypothetical protein